MSFFYNLIEVIGTFCTYKWMNYYFFPYIGLAFLAAVPRLIRLFVTWR